MKILISAVGDTDPIRNFHDGPLLHIVRVYRPEKIVLVHSERSLTKHDKLVKALKSIKDYSPEIILDGGVLQDAKVAIFEDLTKRNLKALIDNYDYQGALELLRALKLPKKQESFSNIKELRKKLTEISDTIKIQGMPDKIVKSKLSNQAKSALNSYLNIDRNHKQGNIAEVLIRVKSLVEFILENYLNNHFLDVITYKEDGKPFLNASKYPEILKKFQEDAKMRGQEYHSGYLSLPAYIGILKFFEPNHDLLKHIYKIQEINQDRNKVAHSLQAFDRENLTKVSSAVFESKQILLASFDIDNHWFSFYEDLNQEIKKLL